MSIPDPIVLLDARAKYVHPAFQMTRASTKTVFDSAGRLVTVPANALGWDHDPATGQARGYLAEPSATNLLLHSNDLTQSSWTAFGSSITVNAITGPDGQGMAKLVENNANQGHSVLQNFTIGDGDTIAAHFIAKAGERVGVQLLFRQNASGANYFQMKAYLTGKGSFDAPTAGGTATVIDGGITHLGGGFYHVWLVGTLGAGITDARLNPGLLDGNGNSSYQGDGTSGLYVGYGQAETGRYPSSYIETAGSTATRANDALAAPGGYGWWRDDRGALLVECEVPHSRTSGYLLSLAGSTVQLRWSGGRDLIINSSTLGGSAQILAPGAAPGRHLIAFGWGDDWVVAADGGIAAAGQMAGAMPASPAIGVGARSDGQFPFGGYVRRAVYYPQRLPNADLQSLTAIQE